jgi:acetyl/propionyl-CoA carboxylase alpha subunit
LVVSGKRLPIKQEDVNLDGWSIEVRINAEDTQAGFAPCTGKIKGLRIPHSPHVRIDTGIRPGSDITPWFDSMIAKLIVHGATREQAIERALKALEQFHVKGIKTTIPYAKAVLNHPVFQSGKATTSFVEKQMKDVSFRDETEALLASLVAVYQHAHIVTPPLASEAAIDPWVLKKRIKNL